MHPIKLNKKQQSILQLFAPQLEKSGRSRVWIILCVVLIIIGLYGLYRQIVDGHIVTGMRDNIVWGYYIANFIYFIGVSYGCAVLAAILFYFRIEWGRPIIRVAALMAFITGIIGPFFILLCIGRFDRLHYLIIYARIQSPITWDVMVISTYLVGITLFVYLLLIKDFAILRDLKWLNIPTWRRKLYRIISLGYSSEPHKNNKINKLTKTMSFIMVPKVLLAFAVLSWIFGMTLRPGWHSTIFGPAYIISSLATSISLIICVMWAYRKIYKLEEYVTIVQFRKLGFILLGLIVAFGYFTFTEYITSWYSSGKWEAELTQKLFSFDEYGWLFHFANLFGIIVPLIIIGFKRFRTVNLITLCAALLVFAMWVRRYLTVVPSLETTLLPIQDTREEYLQYSATWVEWALVIAGSATFLLFFILISKLVNIVPVSDYYTDKNTSQE
jgi:molybdopterin-containing oxidoreductase family membrane subunit